MQSVGETALRRARRAAGLTQGELRARLRDARRRDGRMPPKDSSLKRMYTEWESGRVLPTDWRDELCQVLQLPPAALGLEAPVGEVVEPPAPLEVNRLDPEVVELLEVQTDHYRLMDRKVGAAIIPQTEAHVRHIEQMLASCLPGVATAAAATALAEAAALAGWQALDSGDPARAWKLHDTAKTAARQAEDPAVLAHVTAQQAYALLDAGRPADAAELAAHANRPGIVSRVPARLRAWLNAAQAEFLAAAGDPDSTMRMLDGASDILPPGDADPELPFLMLNASHLARWRGHCLARLGASQAVDDLTAALEGLGSWSSKRAESGLRVDLALALQQRGDLPESRRQAAQARELAGSTGSARQRSRIGQLLSD